MKKISFLNKDFKSRIVLATLGGVLLSSIIFGLLVLWKSTDMSRAALETRVGIEADILASNVNVPTIFDNAQEANEILATAANDKAVISARLHTEDNQQFAYYVNVALRDSRVDRNRLHRDVMAAGDRVGTLTVEYSLGEIAQQRRNVVLFLVLAICFATLTTIALCLPIIKSLLSPLFSLHALSQKITQTRNYSLRAKVENPDEIGRLSSVFNSMLEQIENRDSMLEKQVSQRTRELEKLAEEFRFRAFHDTLTGLPNRALLNECFESNVNKAQKRNTKFGCLLLDLDDFKTINDTKGHEFGDDLLKQVAQRLKKSVENTDLVCRLGGDEFVILVDNIASSQALHQLAVKVLEQLNIEFIIKSESIKTAVSVGGAIFPDHGTDISTIKRHADVAMYHAKDAGKNQFCLFTEGMENDVKYRLIIQNGLQAAKEEQQFEIFFQPKVDARFNKAIGCEALVRWNHPNEGFLTPSKFIPYAEEIGKVSEIDYYVIRQCCEKIAEWSHQLYEPLSIAVNLSGRHFHNLRIVDILREAIYSARISPHLLEVEITEAVLIRDPNTAKKIVHAVKDLGCGISLDDFGTGYSSLDYLRTLPIDAVKLDRSFIQNIDKNIQDKRLTKGIVSLAKNLDLKLIAEGVETLQHKKTLLDLDCHLMQGYYFLPPANNVNFIQWIKKVQNNVVPWNDTQSVSQAAHRSGIS